jgi:hypothetical protein
VTVQETQGSATIDGKFSVPAGAATHILGNGGETLQGIMQSSGTTMDLGHSEYADQDPFGTDMIVFSTALCPDSCE